jgi:hypothetical protein
MPSPPTEGSSSLAKDYASIAALLQQFDHQVTAFVRNTERLAHNAAPAYAGLTDRWIQEAKAISSDKSEGSSIPQQRLKPSPAHSKDAREEEDDDESMDRNDDPVVVV